MAVIKICFEDLSEYSQEELREQVREELLEEKESEWTKEWEDIYINTQENRESKGDEIGSEKEPEIAEDDFVDSKRTEYFEKEEAEAVNHYINRNDSEMEFVL